MTFQFLSAAEWPVLRAVRLSALHDSPDAFLSEHATEERWPDEAWQREAERGDWLVARAGDRVVALLGATPEPDIPAGDRYLSYLWVHPGARRTGVAGALVRTMLDRLRSGGVARAWLWVLEGNDPALALYRALGFAPTGERQPVPKTPGRGEERFSLRLR